MTKVSALNRSGAAKTNGGVLIPSQICTPQSAEISCAQTCGARSLEMGGKARGGLTELYVENNEADDIEKEPSLGCVLVLVKK